MDPDLVIAVGIFIIVVALAAMRSGSVDQVVLLIVGALVVSRRNCCVGGPRDGNREGAASNPVQRLGESGFDPELTGSLESASAPARVAPSRPAPATPYLGAVDGPPLDDTCDAPAWSGFAPDEGDLQADELHVRQVRARDQLPARQQTGIYKRQQLVSGAVEEELQAEEDSVWWGRADA